MNLLLVDSYCIHWFPSKTEAICENTVTIYFAVQAPMLVRAGILSKKHSEQKIWNNCIMKCKKKTHSLSQEHHGDGEIMRHWDSQKFCWGAPTSVNAKIVKYLIFIIYQLCDRRHTVSITVQPNAKKTRTKCIWGPREEIWVLKCWLPFIFLILNSRESHHFFFRRIL